ncbi:hypothetical protein [Bdellovibrio bacteriovorus]|uniref:Lipoprotein n=1 Tax=Bdellovibrio bacteriovorus str. Tiberius TaxID=1069642 RepID=K7ZB04_BDEBC|nr:hypothetical protein [Bdellovibrio bacteriovorus]AFY01999.1 hypothetical protein Bdt_2316 [Bdellovibrio bacteriovorus str. Tiberius]
MKTAKLLSVLFISSALLTTACTPKDEAVTSDAVRKKIIAQNERKNNKNKKAGQQGFKFQFGSFSSTTLIVGKQLEGLEVLRYALDSQDVNKSVYKAEVTKRDDGGDTVKLVADKVVTAYTTSKGEFANTLTKTWDIDVTYVDGQVATVKAVSKKSRNSLDQKNLEKTFVNMNEDEAVVEALNENGVLKVSITAKGVINGRLKNAATREQYEFSEKLEVSLEELLAGKATVKKADAKLDYIKEEGKKPWTSSMKAEKMSVELQGLCNVAIFDTVMKGKNPKNMISTAEGIEVTQSSFKSTYGACGARPTIDLSLMLIY